MSQAMAASQVLTCVTPPAIKGKATKVAKVQIVVDLNPACSTDVDDATNQYNQECRILSKPQPILQF